MVDRVNRNERGQMPLGNVDVAMASHQFFPVPVSPVIATLVRTIAYFIDRISKVQQTGSMPIRMCCFER